MADDDITPEDPEIPETPDETPSAEIGIVTEQFSAGREVFTQSLEL